jgi:hypothetical protein
MNQDTPPATQHIFVTTSVTTRFALSGKGIETDRIPESGRVSSLKANFIFHGSMFTVREIQYTWYSMEKLFGLSQYASV